jgi:dethiobiotin synthetase
VRHKIGVVSFFITGTDTGVGKTHTALQLLRRLRANGRSCAGFKPICCGDRGEAALLLAAGANGLTIDEINPLWLKTPAAPLTAAQIEGVNIDIEYLLNAFRKLTASVDLILVEGVGGWMVPIRSDYFVRDLAVKIGLASAGGGQKPSWLPESHALDRA